MGKYRKFTEEYRLEAVRMMIDTSRPIAQVARDLGINEGTLGNWVAKYRADSPASEELTVDERARLKELKRENRELRLERDFLRKSGSLLRKGTTVTQRYEFIAAERATPNNPFPVRSMCRWLKVSASGFYDHERAVPSARARRRAVVADYVHAVFERGRGAYGVRRVHALMSASTDPRVGRLLAQPGPGDHGRTRPGRLPTARLPHHQRGPGRRRPCVAPF